ncbi:DEAD/DEAH box helicase [Anaeropeptidivorans aminofermentans]|jgi:ATP-dependent RNA helicase DeaD|uniref:DEAD/DEAH box helicase n=1 Tax=Anaeropeptidivorans aminofermentans TaxID=2934315 RepID=UPI0020241BA2|nr:DEAD/DEAH box helicase [Anaeropeptidivorans aminofermentans]
MNTKKFQEMNLSLSVLKAIEDLGYEEATPIQSQSIDLIMKGRDVLGQSQTGTGKTAAFGIPCVELTDPDDRRLQSLVLCPTRELAIQVSEEIRKLLKYKDNVRVLPIYGGQPIDRQITALKKGAQIVIGTPGRVMDHMRRHTLKMDNVKIVILDEADEMLDMGFREDIETILDKIDSNRQTVLFSATMPKGILELTGEYQKDAVKISIAPKELTVPSIYQGYFEVREHNKMEALCRVYDLNNPELALVFCNTKKKVDEIVGILQGRGYLAEALHGDLKQQQRDIVMKKFRNRTLEILVATDVAARGIDVDDIDIVFNYDLPQDEEYYIHRIGRTGRAGKSGKAFTFVVGKEIYKLKDIMRHTNAKISREKLPSSGDIEQVKHNAFIEEIKNTLYKGQLTKYINLAETIISENDITAMDLASALLKMSLFEEVKEEYSDFDVEYSYEKESERFKSPKQKTDKSGKKLTDKNMVRIFINIGKSDGVRAKDIVGALANEGGLSGKSIGNVDIYNDFTFVDIPKKEAHDTIKRMKSTRIKNKKVNLEIAKKK